jgi:endoglucanase
MRKLIVATVASIVGALAALIAVTALPAGAATAAFSIVGDWGGGYQGKFTVTNNTASEATSWRVEFDLPSGSTVSNSWGAQQSSSGNHYTFTNAPWNGSLAAGASASFEFVAVGTGTPTACTVNGSSCGGGSVVTAGPTNGAATTAPPAAANTPVARYGQLRVCGAGLCDKSGAKVQLRGISSMWLNWETQPYAENLQALTWMRDNWNLQVIRAAMGVEPAGAYLSNPSKAKSQVETIINNAVTAGVYVIVDWHAHEAQNNQSQAVAFFADLAKRYGNLPNVIWEPWNEPLQLSWTGVIKPYHQAVVNAIRASDPDNVIVLGTPTWSQDVDVAAQSPVSGTNLMYTLHFYSCTHTAGLRAKGDAAIKAGLALFVTEWGASNADGGLDGAICQNEAQSWIDWMKGKGISWTAWKLDVGTDTTNLLSSGAPVTGGWTNYLRGHGPFVVANMK